MKKIAPFILLILLFSCSPKQQKHYWPEITNEAKPWTRWWWLGSAVDQQNIDRLMKEYADKGIGGVEITPIYGVKGEEENFIDFLSPEWIKMLRASVEAARTNGMGVDMNTGTGWPFGSPTITDEFAAKKMQFHHLGDISQKEVEQFVAKMKGKTEEDLIALSACNLKDRINLLEDGETVDKLDKIHRQVISVTQNNTGQKVKRAAPGGEGLVFNHFSEKATIHYLERFDEAFSGNPGVRCFFNDSYELSSANSAAELFETFKRIKGYDLALYAKELSGQGSKDEVARIKADYRDVLGQMLLYNFTTIWTNWGKEYGAKTKNQAHGSPGNLIDLYAAVGIPEMETFHSTNFPFLQDYIDQSDARHTESNHLFKKFASSAAHMKGEKLVSCETFTWLNEHFKTPLYQCKPELDELFVKGVTHLFFHGTAYSPDRAAWPGWLFYASAHMEPNNPQWEHIDAMNEYIARCQSVLQQGQHTNDFLVYWSPDNYNHDAEKLDKKLTLHNSDNWISMPEINNLLDKGYQFDFVTDRIIANAELAGNMIVTFGASSYKTIVLPHLKRIRLETLRNLLKLAEAGATIIFSNMPEKVSGFAKYKDREAELAGLIKSFNLSREKELNIIQKGKGRIYIGNVETALKEEGITRETLIDYHIKNISRKTETGVYYFIVNHEKEKVDQWLTFKHYARNALLMDPLTGDIALAESISEKVHIVLDPGASGIVYFTNNEIKGIESFPYLKQGNSILLENAWELKPVKGGPNLFEEATLPKLKFWTELPGTENKYFAGTCEYSTTFSIDKLEAENYLLHFEDIEASAKIFLNDCEVATLWSYPYKTEVGEFLKKGENKLRVEVSNLGANRIRYMDRQGLKWKKFYNINMVNIHYKKMDASNWPILPSGLNGKVELIPLTE